MKIISVIIAMVVCIFIIDCSSQSDPDSEITAVVYKNLKAAQNENLEDYMATMDKHSPAYTQTEYVCKRIFNAYDLNYDLKDVKVIGKTDKEAKVQFVLITTKISGPAFRNNKLTGVNILKKNNGEWKIFTTETKSIDYLN